ncbi:MAG: bacteriohemerythrin [Bacteroidales bacterium]|jgi:hemerythrin-like metal-binding protein
MNTLEKIEWTSKFSIGNSKIDDDHKKLISIYNDLVDLIEFQKNREEFAKILTEMTDYSLIHFKKEEEYIEKLLYPKLKEHINYHKDYIYKVAMYNINLLSADPTSPEEIIRFLKKWWINHILSADLDYESFKKETKSDAEY